MENQTPLRIVLFKEDEKFIAQCVDFDICTQADNIETLKDRMDCLIETELKDALASGLVIDPAPKRFHKMWDQQGTHAYKEVAA